MAGKREVLSLAAKLRADVYDSSRSGQLDVTIFAPSGYAWASNLEHSLGEHWFTDPDLGWAELYERMADGLLECRCGEH